MSKENAKIEKKKEEWFGTLKDAFKKSPVASNASFTFILMGLEYFVGMQFNCPCAGDWTGRLSTSALIVIPAIMSFILMLIFEISASKEKPDEKPDEKPGEKPGEEKKKSVFNIIVSSSVPAVIWLTIVLLDGRYVTCAMTNWNGTFTQIEHTHTQWCDPGKDEKGKDDDCHRWEKKGEKEVLTDTYLRKVCIQMSQDFFVNSQWGGIVLLLLICGALMVYGIIQLYKYYYPSEEDQPKKKERAKKLDEESVGLPMTQQRSKEEVASAAERQGLQEVNEDLGGSQ